MLTQRLHLPRTVMPLALLLAWPLAQAQTMTPALNAAQCADFPQWQAGGGGRCGLCGGGLHGGGVEGGGHGLGLCQRPGQQQGQRHDSAR